MKFITGSDCHQWACYPKHDGKESDEAVSYFKHTYLKCLPTFKGLTMALSDYSRIQLGDSFFSVDNRKIKEIKLEVNGNKISIPLSDGINAIIGDNSIGKSLLLHKLTNYKENAVVDEKTKKGYEDYLKTNSVDIQSRINECDLYYFDFQGNVRQRFEDKSGVRNQEFLNQKFPDAPCNEKYIKIIQTEFEKLYECIETKFAFDEEYAKLKTLRMIDKDITARMISCNKIMNNQTSMKGYSSAYKYIDSIISKIDDPKKYSFIEQQDAQNIIKIKDYLTMLSEKYHKHYDGEKRIYDIKNLLNEGIANYNEYAKAYKDEDTKIKEQFEADSVEVASTLMELVKLSKKIKKFAFDITEPIEISPNSLNYNDYVFVKRFKNIKRIDNEYLRSVLNSCIKAKKEINTETITKKGLEEVLKDYDPKVEPLTFLKDKIGERISSDFQIESVILKKDIDQYTSLSNGLNATIYFDIISGDEKQGIYIVDQPEDDVSQKAIKDRLITDFKKMSEKRQIILVTHNPQFVVNLDVDNVICIHKNKGEIAVSSGALEFENEKDNIIQIVADNLDGGVDAIKKRWKRYGKEI